MNALIEIEDGTYVDLASSEGDVGAGHFQGRSIFRLNNPALWPPASSPMSLDNALAALERNPLQQLYVFLGGAIGWRLVYDGQSEFSGVQAGK